MTKHKRLISLFSRPREDTARGKRGVTEKQHRERLGKERKE
jgi:hypothetical protein